MIKRTVFEDVVKHLEKPEISLIIGPRQAGKTTLMLFVKDYLDKKGEKTLFLSLDAEKDRQFFSSQERLLSRINLEFGNKKGFVFIDEIQRKEDAGLFLKGIYDQNPPYKFIVSGSGSLELKEKIHESLVGRKRIFELSTVSFSEFADYKTKYKYSGKLGKFFDIEKILTRQLLEEYLIFGGYPKVILSDSREEKLKMLDEIYQSYLLKDISFLLGVNKTDDFTNLLRTISSQSGKLTNYSELSSTLGISLITVKKFLWYLEKTFVLRKVNPFFRNVRKEITKAPVFYFYDLGLRNYILGSFDLEREGGFLFQNFILNILQEKIAGTSGKINYWRTKEGAEVDFIVDRKDLFPVEVKFKEFKEAKIERSLRSFINKYLPKEAFIINLSLKEETDLNTTKIFFIPYYSFLEEFLLS